MASSLTRAIDVKDNSCDSFSVHQIACLRLVGERSAEQVIEKQAAEGFDWFLGQRGQKAGERRAGRQPITLKQRHEGNGKRLQPLVEGLQCAFTADGIAEENRLKRTRSLSLLRAPCLRRYSVMSTTSPNHEGVEGTECEEAWMITAESIILFIYASFVRNPCILPL